MNASTPPLVLPIFLLLVGIAGLGAAVLLVSVRFQPLSPVGVGDTPVAHQGPMAKQHAPGVAPAPVASSVAAPEPTAAPEPGPEPGPEPVAEPAPAAVVGDQGPWQVSIDHKSYLPDGPGQDAIDAAARALAAEPGARALVVGVNSTRHSSKRALAAARGVRERLMSAGIDGRRCEASAEQLPEVEQPAVRIELKGGDR